MTSSPPIRIVIPVFDDWTPAARLVDELDAVLHAAAMTADLLLVDDASTMPVSGIATGSQRRAVQRIEVLRLRRNVGHQRAIAIALAYLESTAPPDFVVVMDGDGEDRPADVPDLVRTADRQDVVVFAERTRRSEGFLFSALYHLYRGLHWTLTGISVRVGNFSAIPRASLQRLVGMGDLWNHYAAAVFKSRLPYGTIPTHRGSRYSGRSQMNYAALVSHGLSAMAAFGDQIGIRLLGMTVVLSTAVLVAAVFAALSRWSDFGVAGWWLPLALLVTLLLVFQSLAVTLTFVFVILGRRDTATFLPLRDYSYFVLRCEPVGDAIHDRV